MVIGAEGTAPCGRGRDVAGELGEGGRSPTADDCGCAGCSPAGGVAPDGPDPPDPPEDPLLPDEVAVAEETGEEDDFLREDPERFPEEPEFFLAVLLEEASVVRDPFFFEADDFEEDDLLADLAVDDPEDEE